MQTALDYFDQANTHPPATLRQRCFRAIQIVASIWTLLGASCLFFGLRSVPGSTAHLKWEIATIGCLLVAAGIYSVFFPLYYILREPEAAASRPE